jgi:transposase InsO family protein
MSELCRTYEISRKTGYKWSDRFKQHGHADLIDRRRACTSHPNAVAEEIVLLLIGARKQHPFWGPRKILAWLAAKYPRLDLPVASTVGVILKRHGLTKPRRSRQRAKPYTEPFLGCDAPNAVWCADFKGSFALGNSRRCNPLTISDAYSRYLLRCEGLSRTDEGQVRPIFESAFCEFGRPLAIRTDNGPPFATIAKAGLSRLAIWWIKLGIRPERIAPGKPQQNGRHERMHRTLKAETTKPPARTLSEQQLVFDRFRREYNEERPHEALGQRPPWSAYEASNRRYPIRLQEPEYPNGYRVRKVRDDGTLNWQGRALYVAEALAGEYVGIEEISNDAWRVYFADVALGLIADHRLHRDATAWPSPTTPVNTRNPEPKVLPMRPV